MPLFFFVLFLTSQRAFDTEAAAATKEARAGKMKLICLVEFGV
jgi:hypothetical protein